MMSGASAALCVQTAACITPPVVGGLVRVIYKASTEAPCKHQESIQETCCGQGRLQGTSGAQQASRGTGGNPVLLGSQLSKSCVRSCSWKTAEHSKGKQKCWAMLS